MMKHGDFMIFYLKTSNVIACIHVNFISEVIILWEQILRTQKRKIRKPSASYIYFFFLAYKGLNKEIVMIES